MPVYDNCYNFSLVAGRIDNAGGSITNTDCTTTIEYRNAPSNFQVPNNGRPTASRSSTAPHHSGSTFSGLHDFSVYTGAISQSGQGQPIQNVRSQERIIVELAPTSHQQAPVHLNYRGGGYNYNYAGPVPQYPAPGNPHAHGRDARAPQNSHPSASHGPPRYSTRPTAPPNNPGSAQRVRPEPSYYYPNNAAAGESSHVRPQAPRQPKNKRTAQVVYEEPRAFADEEEEDGKDIVDDALAWGMTRSQTY